MPTFLAICVTMPASPTLPRTPQRPTLRAPNATIPKPIAIPSRVFDVPEDAPLDVKKNMREIKELTAKIRALQWQAHREGTLSNLTYTRIAAVYWSAMAQILKTTAWLLTVTTPLATYAAYRYAPTLLPAALLPNNGIYTALGSAALWLCTALLAFLGAGGSRFMSSKAASDLTSYICSRLDSRNIHIRSSKLLAALRSAGVNANTRKHAHSLRDHVVQDLESSKSKAIEKGLNPTIVREFDTVIDAAKTIIISDPVSSPPNQTYVQTGGNSIRSRTDTLGRNKSATKTKLKTVSRSLSKAIKSMMARA